MLKIQLTLYCIVLVSAALSADLYSRADGSWNNENIWSSVSHTGPSCNCTPSSSDNIYINHNITLTKNLVNQGSNQNGITALLQINSGGTLDGGNSYDVDIRSTGTLDLCGTLTAKNVIFSNGSAILVCPSANLVINGNFENKNYSVNVTINGNMTVGGSFVNGTGGVITGSGVINIINGPMTNNGTTMGCNGNPCSSSFPCSVSGPCAVTLPVELTEFDGEPFKNYIRVYWTTASEKDNDYFTLDKSLDGKTFSELSRIKGNGNSNITRNYAYRDLYPNNGSNYYRLKQYDYDGKVKTYDIIQVLFLNHHLLSVHPNPTNGKSLNISLNISEGEAFIDILNFQGKSVFKVSRFLDSGTPNNFIIDEIKSLPDGIYTLRILTTSGIQREKLLVSN
jgi:hypothetical protein